MRIGFNPNKDKPSPRTEYVHQVVIPVYIPNQVGYFKDSLMVFKRCLTSLFGTIHQKTFVTIVNNGSCKAVKDYLEELYNNGAIHELIHTQNIGKLNAIIKGLVGNEIELVTISDADVLFLPYWQKETQKIFRDIPKAGVVGVVPQFKMYEANCGNVIFDNMLNKKMRFLPVKNPMGIERFYESIGWDKSYNNDYLKYNLGLEINSNLKVLIGSGHFVATYKKDIFDEIKSYLGYQLGGTSEAYLDKAPLKKGYWRLTTQDNYAYHLGNTYEEWMAEHNEIQDPQIDIPFNFPVRKKTGALSHYFKNKIFPKFAISMPFFNKLFLRWKGLPRKMVKNY